MPLGDSITAGTIDGSFPVAELQVAYREPLYDLLKAAGYEFDFVGSVTNGINVVPKFDYNNEGHGGWTALDLAYGQAMDGSDGVFAWLDANPADIVLLHAGTNGLNPTTGPGDVAQILDEIDRWERSANGNHVTVILALIIDQSPTNPNVTAFNNNLYNMALSRITNDGDDIIIVNQQQAIPDYTIIDNTSKTGYMGSKLHPNNNGYAEMANAWFTEVTSRLSKCP